MDGESQSQARARALKREQFASDFRWLMNDPRGRRLVARLLADTRMFVTTYNPLSKQPEIEMAFAEGQKNLGYRLMADINAICPDQYFLMMKETHG